MVISKKTAFGGIAALGGTTAVGVTVSELSKQYPINETLKKRLNGLNDPKFVFDLTTESCENSLRVKEQYDDNEYKNAIASCLKTSTLSQVAKNLDLDVLSKTNKSNSGVAGGDNNKEKINEIVGKKLIGDKVGSEKSEKEIVGNVTKGKVGSDVIYPAGDIVVKGCENQKLTPSTTVEDGHNFLIACTKNGKELFGVPKNKAYLGEIETVTKDSTVNSVAKVKVTYLYNQFLGGTSKVSERNKYLGQDLGTKEEKVRGKIKAAGFELKDGVESNDCKTKLESKFKDYGTDFQDAVKACAKSKDFKTRAKDLGFNVVPEADKDDCSGKGLGDFTATEENKVDKGVKDTRDEFKKRIKGAIGSTLTETEDGNASHSKIKSHCSDTNNNKTYDNADEASGQKYLKACTKNKSISREIDKNSEKAIGFGTGEYTETVSNS